MNENDFLGKPETGKIQPASFQTERLKQEPPETDTILERALAETRQLRAEVSRLSEQLGNADRLYDRLEADADELRRRWLRSRAKARYWKAKCKRAELRLATSRLSIAVNDYNRYSNREVAHEVASAAWGVETVGDLLKDDE